MQDLSREEIDEKLLEAEIEAISSDIRYSHEEVFSEMRKRLKDNISARVE